MMDDQPFCNDPERELAERILESYGIVSQGAQAESDAAKALQPMHVRLSKYTIIVPLKGGDRAIAFNSRSHSLVVLDADDLRVLDEVNSQGVVPMTNPALAPFVALGFMAPEGLDELGLLREEYWRKRSDPSSFSVTIAPTLACNMACGYCFQGLDKPTKRMTDDVRERLGDFIGKRIQGVADFGICWYGGEPLMDKKAIYSLSDRLMGTCASAGVSYSASMVTNGFLLDRDTALELDRRAVSSIQITIDGFGEAHDKSRPLTSGKGSYERILKNILSFIDDVKLTITIRVNVAVENAPTLKRMLEDFVARGLSGRSNFNVYFAPVEAATNETLTAEDEMLGKVDYAKTELELTRFAVQSNLMTPPRTPSYMGICVAPKENGLVIGPTGELHKCWDTIQNSHKKVGTIFEEDSLFSTPQSKMWQAWDPFDNPVCSSCKIAPLCSGFCEHKFLFPEETRGEMGALPCPPWKFNVAEYLFLRAEEAQLVRADDWDETQATHLKWHAGFRHTRESMLQAHERVVEKVASGDYRKPATSCGSGCGCAQQASVVTGSETHPTAGCG